MASGIMFGTKMVRVGNFDALKPIKYHRSSRPIIRRADEEPGSNLDVLGSQVVIRLGQRKMLECQEDGGDNVRDSLILLCSSGWSWNGAMMGETTLGHPKWLCMLSWQPCPVSLCWPVYPPLPLELSPGCVMAVAQAF